MSRSSGRQSQATIWLLLAIGAVLVLTLYALVDPGRAAWMPKCIFHAVTGLQCPGCGAQRAIHALLTGDFAEAWRFNPLVIAVIPYLAILLFSSIYRLRYPGLYARLNSPAAIIVAGVVIIAWFIIRNTLLS